MNDLNEKIVVFQKCFSFYKINYVISRGILKTKSIPTPHIIIKNVLSTDNYRIKFQ